MTDLVALRRQLHRRPELGFMEIETAVAVIVEIGAVADEVTFGASVCDLTGVAGLPAPADLASARARAFARGVAPGLVEELGHGATGIVATVKGDRPGQVTALRFDMDALPVHEADGGEHRPTRVGFASEIPGLMHACGHDGHVAVGVELVRRLAADRDFAGEVRAVFQPAEEGVRGAHAMVAAGAVDGVDVMLGMHLGIGLPVGTVAAAAAGVLATEKWRIVLTGRAAHAALAPAEGRNALLGAAAAVTALHALPPEAGVVTRVNVGRLVAGTAANVVPESAILECEVRADDDGALRRLADSARHIVAGAAAMYELEVAFEVTGTSAVAVCDTDVTEAMARAAARVPGIEHALAAATMTASDDVTLMMSHVQGNGGRATLTVVGASSPAPHHHPRFDVDERALPLAVAWLEAAIRTGFRVPPVVTSQVRS
ncbi:amidohydrolase [Occultella glacieicola]|uniref:Amidohydrolase n=1 Tax=Occultella glacieicola TaxID=2518684 RepID=A0ABY2DX27_9MICO|nr:amidohydrolase [Occultella glacieicola]TDE88537.1 amidohydrolase [Occultella glacieicola]